MQKGQNKKKNLIAAVAAIALIAAFIACYLAFAPKGSGEAKDITVQVVHADGTIKEWEISTQSENLRGALEEQELIEGDDSGATLFVTAVDGYVADAANEEWWCFTKDGEAMMTGVDDTVIADGEKYEITLTVGYDW